MNALISLQRKTWMTDKDLEQLTIDQLRQLSVYSGFIKLSDKILLELVKDKEFAEQELAYVRSYMLKRKNGIIEPGRFEEQVFGKNATLFQDSTSVVVEHTGNTYEFTNKPFPQDKSVTNFKDFVVIYLNHTFKVDTGKVVVAGNLSFKMAPDQRSPFLLNKIGDVLKTWDSMVTTHRKLGTKSMAEYEYSLLVLDVLRKSSRADRIALEHVICESLNPKKIKEMVNSKEYMVWDPSLVVKSATIKEDNSSIMEDFKRVKDVINSATKKGEKQAEVKMIVALPKFKIRYAYEVPISKLIKLMQAYGTDMGGPKSSVNVTFANRSFVGRMSERIREMVIICSIVESLSTNNPTKFVYLVAEVGQVAVLCETFKARNIERVKLIIPAKNFSQFHNYANYLTSNTDVLAEGITVLSRLSLLTNPKKDTDVASHYAQELSSMMPYDVYIGQCFSEVAFTDRVVREWFINQYGFVVSSKKEISLVDRWAGTGREQMNVTLTYASYCALILKRLKESYETIYAPIYFPEKNVWSTILKFPSKGVSMSYSDDEGFTIINMTNETEIEFDAEVPYDPPAESEKTSKTTEVPSKSIVPAAPVLDDPNIEIKANIKSFMEQCVLRLHLDNFIIASKETLREDYAYDTIPWEAKDMAWTVVDARFREYYAFVFKDYGRDVNVPGLCTFLDIIAMTHEQFDAAMKNNNEEVATIESFADPVDA